MNDQAPTPMSDEEREALERKNAAIEAAMVEQGVPTEERRPVDYFAAAGTYDVMLPDGVQYVTVKEFREGDRRKYLSKVNRDIRIEKVSGDAKMRGPAGEEKVALLQAAIVGWYLFNGGAEFPYSERALATFIDAAPPAVIDHIDREIRKHEPWLQTEATVEEIDQEIEALQEMRAKAVEREAGKAAS